MSTSAPRPVLIEAADLERELAGARPPVLLDVRWALGDPDGYQHYLDAHLPGARFVDLERELAAPASATSGRHPLPALADLHQSARRWGLGTASRVVGYDNSGALAAARAWWLLRWAGVEDVRILNGGLGAWRGAVETGAARRIAAGDVELVGDQLPVLTASDAAAFPDRGVLLDARAGERYRGEVEPIDSRAGHIPGAISAPTTENVGGDGRLLAADELRERYAGLGVTADTPVAVYCGSGVTAAHEIAALAVAGIPAILYPGSWSAWSSDPSRPAATGASPR